jgi:hypothetical protein
VTINNELNIWNLSKGKLIFKEEFNFKISNIKLIASSSILLLTDYNSYNIYFYDIFSKKMMFIYDVLNEVYLDDDTENIYNFTGIKNLENFCEKKIIFNNNFIIYHEISSNQFFYLKFESVMNHHKFFYYFDNNFSDCNKDNCIIL